MVNEEPLRRWKKIRKKRGSPRETVALRPAVPPPRWVPSGIEFSSLPQAVQAAVIEIVSPVYEQLVLGTAGALEKSTGLTLMHQLWLEILDQLDLGRGYCDDALINSMSGRPELIARHLQLVDAKVKASYVLVRLWELRAEWDESGDQSRPGGPAAIPGPAASEGGPDAARPEIR